MARQPTSERNRWPTRRPETYAPDSTSSDSPGGQITLDDLNAQLHEAGFGPVGKRTHRHYRNLSDAGLSRYITINEFDIARALNDVELTVQAGFPSGAPLRTLEDLIGKDEDYAVEFKSTARWDIRESQRNKAMEDAVVKTIAGFLNTEGGTLLIGIGPERETVGLKHDYPHVKPQNGDGFINWLTTHLINAFGYTAVTRTRARITSYLNHDICRVDVAPAASPALAKTSKADDIFYVRVNNSTRVLPSAEVPRYLSQRWPRPIDQ